MAQPDPRRRPVVTDPSLKARSAALFDDEAVRTVQAAEVDEWKPFREYLRTTPAAPFSPATKALLSLAAVAVTLLFGAAVWRLTQARTSPPAASAPAR
ncbi:MAG: hypothetical protein KatS3mg108_0475 [Isosphaeraceae bacterium]|jgi:hypothetical protein|nr:MAG: hypothetical protein KatS3mg108_0475 [Isosphaeraceae bacterium]